VARTTSTAGPPGTVVVVVVVGGVVIGGVVVERVVERAGGAAVGGPAHPARAVVAAIPSAARREIRRVTPQLWARAASRLITTPVIGTPGDPLVGTAPPTATAIAGSGAAERRAG
jgi:hypothetical protein